MHTSQLPPRPSSNDSVMDPRRTISHSAASPAQARLYPSSQAVEHLLDAQRQPTRSQQPDLPQPVIVQPHLEAARAAGRLAPNRPAMPTEQQHRVYLLSCAHCETFLSDRGMRAVLLLKPNITLFSTDASPLNTGPLFADVALEGGDQVERTCDCLTQSLGCHGCGSQIGYHIVAPCQRCTQSVTKHQRAANGHRFVFHFGEVTARERRYYPGEPGVLPQSLAMLPRMQIITASQATPDPSKAAHPSHSSSETHLTATSTWAPAALRHRRPLQAGDLVYWSHLRPGGERSEPIDPRTRPFHAPELPGR